MPPNTRINRGLRGVKSKSDANGLNGRTRVRATMRSVAMRRYFPGLLLKNDLRLLMTSTMTEAEITDSMNQPVLN
jgi:hypothetical protein